MRAGKEAEAWAMIHAERVRIRTMLEALSPHQWRTASLCSAWSVEQVTAHLTAAASTGWWAWARSIVRAGFNPGRHNEARLAQHLGTSPEETLARFTAAVPLTLAPTRDPDDAAFQVGSGPAVSGPILDLVMVMAGRATSLTRLRGDGVVELRRRIG